MSGDTAAGPTLGEAYWRGHIGDLYGDPDRFPYSALDDETRRAVETGAAAAGAAAIARLNQPAELAAAMTETRKARELLHRVRSVLLEDGPRMRQVAIGLIDHNPIGG